MLRLAGAQVESLLDELLPVEVRQLPACRLDSRTCPTRPDQRTTAHSLGPPAPPRGPSPRHPSSPNGARPPRQSRR
jgi:hypothetical protein